MDVLVIIMIMNIIGIVGTIYIIQKQIHFGTSIDGFGEPVLLVKKVKDYAHLKEIITALNLDI